MPVAITIAGIVTAVTTGARLVTEAAKVVTNIAEAVQDVRTLGTIAKQRIVEALPDYMRLA